MGNVIAEVLLTAKEQLDNSINKSKTVITEINELLERIKNSDIITEVHDARGDKASLKDRLEDIDNNLINYKNEVCVFTMPTPVNAEYNTMILQGYLNFGRFTNTKVEIRFGSGTYDLNTCVIYDNTTIILQKDTIINQVRNTIYNPNLGRESVMNPLFLNAKPFDETDSKITGYNGNGNITIEANGGVIKAYNPFAFIHGKNIKFNNIVFEETKAEHCYQIGSCKNVEFNKCDFVGMISTTDDRKYVEMIQLDWATYTAMPYWLENGAIYDNGVNDNIRFKNCRFRKGEGDYANVYTCIGSHGATTVKNNNIHIDNCDFSDFSYTAIRPYNMKNVYINDCKFNTNSVTPCLNIYNSENVYINNCDTNGGSRLLFSTNSIGVTVNGVTSDKLNGSDSFMLFGESQDITVRDITFKNCNSTNYGVLIRNCKDVFADNIKDINNTIASSNFFRVGNKDDGVSDRFVIKNISTNCNNHIYATNTTNLIDDITDETLFKGNITQDNITLSDNIDNFKDLKICFNWYGNVNKDLDFYSNIAYIKEFNIADDISMSTEVYFLEGKIEKIDNKTLNIKYLNQININNGTNKSVLSTAGIIKISGKRIKFGS